MSSYSKYNVIYRLQKWLDSVPGQTFMNYAYSWGASVVILGTLFKLTHLPGANIMLFIGMGTEVFVFFISAFDRPFDKTQDGVELSTTHALQAELAAMDAGQIGEAVEGEVPVVSGVTGNAGVGGTIIMGGGNVAAAGAPVAGDAVVTGDAVVAEGETPVVGGPRVIGGINGPMTPAPAVTQETAEAMEDATKTYVERLNDLNETFVKVAELSKRLATDSEEMENLNRTLTGIAKVYELQLKSASQQIGTQDEINEQIRTLRDEIEQLNQVYARMIEAMTVNMPGAAGKLNV